MSKLNPVVTATAPLEYLAGGFGMVAARQDKESQLRRAVMSCLLFEDLAYESAQDNADNIANLIPQVHPETVANIAIECREVQKLRHVPLFIASEMSKYTFHKGYVSNVLQKVITRPDQITDFLAIYWRDGKKPISGQVKKGLAKCFNKFNEFQFAKYDRDAKIKLRDVMFMVHPKPEQGKEELFKKIAERTLATPDTWEVALSTGKDKKETWIRLIKEKKLGALAMLRNIRNMEQSGVPVSDIIEGINGMSSAMLLPLNFVSAREYASDDRIKRAINKYMGSAYQNLPKLSGTTVFVVDVSGSMVSSISSKGHHTRLSVAAALGMFASYHSDDYILYVTAGSDSERIHNTERLSSESGFDMYDKIMQSQSRMGGGGIFTRQCLEHIKRDLKGENVDRIIVFSDSQDCDYGNSKPEPFGKNNYIVDVSSHKNGINYKGVWTAEVSGWSENFISFISCLEGQKNTIEDEE